MTTVRMAVSAGITEISTHNQNGAISTIDAPAGAPGGGGTLLPRTPKPQCVSMGSADIVSTPIPCANVRSISPELWAVEATSADHARQRPPEIVLNISTVEFPVVLMICVQPRGPNTISESEPRRACAQAAATIASGSSRTIR